MWLVHTNTTTFFHFFPVSCGEQQQTDHHGKKNAHNSGRWVHVGCTMTYWWLTTAPITDREMKRIEIIHFVLTCWHVGQPHLGDLRTRAFQLLGGMILEEQLAGLTARHTLWTADAQKTPACYWYRGGSSDGKDAGSKDVLGVSFTRTWCSGCSVSLSRLDQPSMIWFLSRFQTCDLAPLFHHFPGSCKAKGFWFVIHIPWSVQVLVKLRLC